jgi:hypothetical protein
VLEYEVPAFLADIPATQVNITPSAPLYPAGSLAASSAVYALWIGTNDLGIWAFLTDSQVPGKVLADYTSCVYAVFDQLYAAGGWVFVLMNTVPLELAPLYANDTLHGVGDNQYWPEKWTNHTQVAEAMREATTSVNQILAFQTPFELLVANRYPGAHFAIFDTYSLVSDIITPPQSTSTELASRPVGRVCGAMRTTARSISPPASSGRTARIQMPFSGMTSCIRGKSFSHKIP